MALFATTLSNSRQYRSTHTVLKTRDRKHWDNVLTKRPSQLPKSVKLGPSTEMAIITRSSRIPYNSPSKPRAAGPDSSVNQFGSMRTELSQKQGCCPPRRSKRTRSGKAVAFCSNQATHTESTTKLPTTRKDSAAGRERRRTNQQRSSRIERSDLREQQRGSGTDDRSLFSIWDEICEQDAIRTMDNREILDDMAREHSSKVDYDYKRMIAAAEAGRHYDMHFEGGKGFARRGLCKWKMIHRLDVIFRRRKFGTDGRAF